MGGRFAFSFPIAGNKDAKQDLWLSDVLQQFLQRTTAHTLEIDERSFGGGHHCGRRMATSIDLAAPKTPQYIANATLQTSAPIETQVWPTARANAWMGGSLEVEATSMLCPGRPRPQVRRHHWSWKGGPTSCTFLNENFLTGELATISEAEAAIYIHVDDGIILRGGSDHVPTNTMLEEVANGLEQIGFGVSERNQAPIRGKILGFEVDPTPGSIAISPIKACTLQSGLEWIAKRPFVNTRLLSTLLGIWVWAAALDRTQLSVPSNLFSFLTKHFPKTVNWWPSARKEVVEMAALIGGLKLHTYRDLSNMVIATDAEGHNEEDCGGFGMVVTMASPTLVQQAAMGAGMSGFTVTKLDGSCPVLKNPEKELRCRVPVTQVPDELLSDTQQWTPVTYGRWAHKEHITLLEGRVGVKALEILATDPLNFGRMYVGLLDNMPYCGASAKGRSPTFRLNKLLRRRSALQLTTDILLSHPWTDTFRMPADFLSRLK